MRILALTNLPSPYRVEFFNELGKISDLTVMFERYTAGDRDDNWKAKSEGRYKEVYLRGRPIGNDSSFTFKAARYIKQKEYDILFIMGYASPTSIFAITYCRLNNIPYILNSDGAVEKPTNVLKRALKKFLIGGAHAWLCTGKHTSSYLQKYGSKEEKTYIYPFTSLTEKDVLQQLPASEEKKRLRELFNISQPTVVLAVGRFIPLKRYDVLIEAFACIDGDAELLIIGGGEEKETYENLIAAKDIKNIILIDFKTKNELSNYYRMADIFVHPTSSDVWGLVINEAMGYGLPVITTEKCVAGIELVKDSENGYIVRAGDAEQLEARLSELLKNNCKRHEMAEANLHKIRGYTIEQMAKRHIDIFETLT